MSFIFSILDYSEICLYDHLLHHIMQGVAHSLVKLPSNLAVSSQWAQTVEIYCCYANTCGIQGNKLSTVSIVVNYLNCLNKDTMQHSAALWSTAYFPTLTRKLVPQQLQKDRKVTAHACESPSPPSLLSSNFSSSFCFLSHLFTSVLPLLTSGFLPSPLPSLPPSISTTCLLLRPISLSPSRVLSSTPLPPTTSSFSLLPSQTRPSGLWGPESHLTPGR